MSRKFAFALGGAFLGVVAVWLLIKVASSGYDFGQFLARSGAG
ncbi:hypothetical protein [Silanimonas sp.]|jgi:hypothetical protein